MSKVDKRNASKCMDLTPYQALNNIERAEKKEVHETIGEMKDVARGKGYKVKERIVLQNIKSGRVYK